MMRVNIMLKKKGKKLLISILWKAFVFSILLLSIPACEEEEDEEEEDLIGNWIKLSDFEGVARTDAVAFTIGNKAYVGTGYDGSNRLNDFWEYDPQLNNWTRKADFPGIPRNGAVGFGTDSKGYIGTGFDGTNRLNDFWEYDPTIDQWVKKRSIADVTEEDYDDDYTSITGTNKVAFSINGKGYIATGGAGTAGTAVWEYNPVSDSWVQKTSLEASGRVEAIGFSIGDLGYVTTGRNSGYYFDDLWGFQPNSGQVDYDKIMATSIFSGHYFSGNILQLSK